MNKWGIWKHRNKKGEIDPGVTQEHLSGVSKAASNQLRQIFCLAVWRLCELLCLYWSCYCSPAVKWQMDVSILRDLWLLADSCFQNSCIIELALVLQEGRKTKMGKKKATNETYGASLYCEIIKSIFLSSFWRPVFFLWRGAIGFWFISGRM